MTNPRHTARTDDLVVQETGDELLVYDKRTDVAHCLTTVAAAVWRACAEGAEIDEIVHAVSATGVQGDAETLALTALDELAAKGLLRASLADPGTISRRQALRRMAGASMAAAAVPLVVSAAVTTPEAAASHPCTASNTPCVDATTCCHGLQCATVVNASGTAIVPGAKVCHTNATCTGTGFKPGGTNCSTTNRSQCCSGQCGGTPQTQNECA